MCCRSVSAAVKVTWNKVKICSGGIQKDERAV